MSRSDPLAPKGTDLRALRSAARLRQRDVAELIGVSRKTVVRWELGHCAVPPAAYRLLELLISLSAEAAAHSIAQMAARHASRPARIEGNCSKRRTRSINESPPTR